MSDPNGSGKTGGASGASTAKDMAHLMAELKQKSIERMSLRLGQRVLDVGCGTGTSTLALAKIVGVTGVVRGVDYDAAMITEAQRRARLDRVDSWVFYHRANAAALPWPDGSFHASRSDRVLQHMLEPERAFDELVRVTQPGGRVVVIDGDWATLSIDSDDPDIGARRSYFQETLRPTSPLSGQCLHRLFSRHGLLEIQINAQPVFEQGADVSRCWRQSCTSTADADGRFASANVVMVSGRKADAKMSLR